MPDKIKVGDQVILKGFPSYSPDHQDVFFNPKMSSYVGKTIIVKKLHRSRDAILVKGNHPTWTWPFSACELIPILEDRRPRLELVIDDLAVKKKKTRKVNSFSFSRGLIEIGDKVRLLEFEEDYKGVAFLEYMHSLAGKTVKVHDIQETPQGTKCIVQNTAGTGYTHTWWPIDHVELVAPKKIKKQGRFEGLI